MQFLQNRYRFLNQKFPIIPCRKFTVKRLHFYATIWQLCYLHRTVNVFFLLKKVFYYFLLYFYLLVFYVIGSKAEEKTIDNKVFNESGITHTKM
jgi:hypothetical protein